MSKAVQPPLKLSFSLSPLRKAHATRVCSALFGKKEKGHEHATRHMQLILERVAISLFLNEIKCLGAGQSLPLSSF
jgi:hypothetical protein